MPIPPDFVPHFRSSPVTRPWEPLYSREQEGVIDIGFEVTEAHCNSRGFLHGGVIVALADNAMGLSYVKCVRLNTNKSIGELGAVTVNLAIDYVSSAHRGEWIEIDPRIVRAGAQLGFVDAIVRAGDRLIARANATFRLLAENEQAGDRVRSGKS